MKRGEIVVTHGSQGWSNRKGGCEAYGPLGRWVDGAEVPDRDYNNVVFGDLLGDHLDELGVTEGCPFIVIASTSRFDGPFFDALRANIESFVADYRENC